MQFTKSIKMIAFDADDTLWMNQLFYDEFEAAFTELLSQYFAKDEVSARLLATENRNVKIFGYGAKSFMLSMIETAVTLSHGTIPPQNIQQIIDLGKAMLTRPIQLLDGVQSVLESLETKYPLMVLTKGDLMDQQSKLARSGLGRFFQHVEVVSDKKPATYRHILHRYGLQPDQFVMIGNSLRSDILPVLDINAHAIHIPYQFTWAHEQVAESELNGKQFLQLDSIHQVVDCFV
ncbi:MAG: HAD family hydrolase [Chloroflexi bacterium]|nr:MAG: HAD family hydrolase [Chloroflexota bacterium]